MNKQVLSIRSGVAKSSAAITPERPLGGVCSAVLVPRTSSGELDLAAMERLIAFLQARGLRSFAVNGATGEYTRSSVEEVRQLVRCVREQLSPGATMVVGAGAADLPKVQQLLDMAQEEGAAGILLPIPYYFPYSQSDIAAFVGGLRLTLPTYLYNLPSFTTAVEPRTALELYQGVKLVAGVKDSSGSLATVELLKAKAPDAGRIIGNDGALYEALAQGLCHGVVSGVAGVLPELMLGLYAAADADAMSAESAGLRDVLHELIAWLDQLPVPWGLKVIAEVRGLGAAEYSLPLSVERAETRIRFERWIEANRDRLRIA